MSRPSATARGRRRRRPAAGPGTAARRARSRERRRPAARRPRPCRRGRTRRRRRSPRPRARLTMLGERGREVGVVVLDADGSTPVALERVAGREVVGMEVVGDDSRRRPRTGARSGRPRSRNEVSVSKFFRSPMWWETQARRPLASAERALQLGPAARAAARASTGSRAPPARSRASAAAAAARRARPARACADHRVVGADVDRPVVEQEQVGDPGEPLERVVVVERDRLVGDVAGGHHQRPPRRRRAGGGAASREASPRGRRSGARPTALPPAPPAPRAITIGRSRPGQRRSSAASARPARARRLEVGRHHGERLVLAMLAGAQRATRAPRRRRGRRGGSRRAP